MATWAAPDDGSAGIWRWYVFLAVGQVLDVVLTYVGLSRGLITEGNPLMAPIIHTPIPTVLKAFATVYLAVVIARVLSRPRGRAFLVWGVRLLGAATALVLLMHAWALTGALAPAP